MTRGLELCLVLALLLQGCTCEDEQEREPETATEPSPSQASASPAAPASTPEPVRTTRPDALAGEAALRAPLATLQALQRFAAAAKIAEATTLDEAALRQTLLGPLRLAGATAVDLTQPVRLLVLDPAAHPAGQVLVLSAETQALLRGARRRSPPAPGNRISVDRDPQSAPGQAGSLLHINPLGRERLALSEDAQAFGLVDPYLRDADPRVIERDLTVLLYGPAIFEQPVAELQRLASGQLDWLLRRGMPEMTVGKLREQVHELGQSLRQVEQTGLGLDLDAAALHARADVEPEANSAWARFNRAQAAGPLPFTRALSGDALLVAAGRLHLAEAMPLLVTLVEELFSFSPKRKSEARAQIREVAAGLDGRVATFAGAGSNEPHLVALLGSPQPRRVRDHLVRLLQGFKRTPLLSAAKQRGLALDLRVETAAAKHGKLVLDRVRLDTRALPLLPLARRMLATALGGSELELWLAPAPDALLLGLGQGGKQALVATLERIASVPSQKFVRLSSEQSSSRARRDDEDMAASFRGGATPPAATRAAGAVNEFLTRDTIPPASKAPQEGQLRTVAPRAGVLLLWPGAIARARSASPLRIELWTDGPSGRLSADLTASAVAQVLGQVLGQVHGEQRRPRSR